MGYVNYERGEFDLSRDRIQSWHDGLMEILPQAAQDQRSYTAMSLHCGLGLIEVEQGKIDSARSHLKEHEALLPKVSNPQKYQGHYKLLGEVLLAEKSYDEAISVLKDAPKMKMPWLWLTQPVITYNLATCDDLLAQAYREKGDLNNAIGVYERLTDPNPENRDGWLIRPLYYYDLAELYEKFLTLCKDADLWIAEVEDTRKRLANLKSR